MKLNLDGLPPKQRREILRRYRKAQILRQAEDRKLVEEARARNLLDGMTKECWLPREILRDRSMKAWRKAQKWHQLAEFVDYELVMATRPKHCRVCKEEMGNEFQLAIVHRESLESGGKHEPENIEVIHKNCHRKTAKKAPTVSPQLPMEEFMRQWAEKRGKEEDKSRGI